MKIIILTYGSRGDVQPMIALGVGLQTAGYQVQLVAPAKFTALIEQAGITPIPLPGDIDELARELSDTAGGNIWRAFQVFIKYAFPMAQAVIQQVLEVVAEADMLIHSFAFSGSGPAIARHLNIPDISVQLFPVFVNSGRFPNPGFPPLPWGAWYNRLSHTLFNQLYWRSNQLSYWWFRRKLLAQAAPHERWPTYLPPKLVWPFGRNNGRATPLLFGISPHVLPELAQDPTAWRH